MFWASLRESQCQKQGGVHGRREPDEANSVWRPNKEMQLTKPVQIGASQLISSVRHLLEGREGGNEG